jgi:hypothetical protein
VVQALPSNRADELLGVWILPGTSRCCENLLDAQRLDSHSNFSLSVCERLYDLLRRPSPGRMLGRIEMQHLATIMFQDDQYEQYPHCDCGRGKEIDGDQLASMVVKEGPPRLARWRPEPAQDAQYGALGDGDAELSAFVTLRSRSQRLDVR